MKILKKLFLTVMLFILGAGASYAKEQDLSKIILKDINGIEYDFGKQNKEIYVKFWASWCPICLSGLDDIDKLSGENKNFEVITVVTPGLKGEKKTEAFKNWYKALGYKNIKVLLDEKAELSKALNIRVYPTSIILGKDAKVKKIIPGHLEKEKIEGLFSSKMENKMMNDSDMKIEKDMKNSTMHNMNMKDKKAMQKSSNNIAEIHLAGGCFWGVEAYMEKIYGVVEASSGYANGKTKNPKYEDLIYKNSGHAETVLVKYDKDKIDLSTLLKYYFKIIDPTSLNKQGNDRGTQYRTGVYYSNKEDKDIIEEEIKEQQKKYKQKIVVEVLPLSQFYLAEEYHQDYLKKNPNGYCHIDLSKADDIIVNEKKYPKLSEKDLKAKLNSLQYEVTQNAHTERAFQNDYWNFFEKGLYVDITTGEPLFSSSDKYDSQCGWPSFVKPIVPEVVTYHKDTSFNMLRTEVKSRSGNAHLGHVFDDGPKNRGGKRYCINSAAIEFIPYGEMESRGYGYLIPLIK